MKRVTEFLKIRVLTNWKTTLMGLFLLLAVLALVWTSKATLVEAMPLVMIGLGFMGLKDPQNTNR